MSLYEIVLCLEGTEKSRFNIVLRDPDGKKSINVKPDPIAIAID